MVLQYTTSHFALCCRRLSLMCSMGHSRYICTLLNVPSNARCNDVLIRYACLVLQKIGVDYHWWLVFTDSTSWIRTTSLYMHTYSLFLTGLTTVAIAHEGMPTHAGTSHCSCRWNCWHCYQSNAVGEFDYRSRRTQLLALVSQRAYAWLWGSRKTPPGHRLKSRGRGAPRWGSGTRGSVAEWRASCQLWASACAKGQN